MKRALAFVNGRRPADLSLIYSDGLVREMRLSDVSVNRFDILIDF